jgi:hypothetical protein
MVDVDAANKQAGAMTGFSHQQQTDLQLQAQDVKGKGGAAVSHDSHTARLHKTIRTDVTLNSSSIRPSHQDSLLYTTFSRTHPFSIFLLYINYQ